MLKPDATRRIIHSRQVLHGWRAVPPAGRIESTLAMIAAEIDILDGIAAAFPEKAETLAVLVKEWRAMAEGLRAKAN